MTCPRKRLFKLGDKPLKELVGKKIKIRSNIDSTRPLVGRILGIEGPCYLFEARGGMLGDLDLEIYPHRIVEVL